MLTTRHGVRVLGAADLRRLPGAGAPRPGGQRVRGLPRPDHQPRAALARRRDVGPVRRRRADGGLPRRRQPGAGAGDHRRRPGASPSARWPAAGTVSTIVGPQDAVRTVLGRRREPPGAGPASCAGTSRTWRSPDRPAGRARPRVRRTHPRRPRPRSIPACVAMYTEEVGVSPEYGGGAELYRTRVRQLSAAGWSFARFEDGPAGLQGGGRVRHAVRRADPGCLGAAGPPRRGSRRARDGGGGRAGPRARSPRSSRSTSTSGTAPPARPTSGSASARPELRDDHVLTAYDRGMSSRQGHRPARRHLRRRAAPSTWSSRRSTSR